MVSLRQRSSRPSYAALPEGFEGLSDEDGTASAGTNEGDAGPAHDSAVDPALRALQSEGNMPSSSAATSDGGMDDDMGDSESMSSGSDAYAPEADDGRKRRKVKLSKKASTTSIGKGKAGKGFSQGSGAGKGKGKGKASQQFELSDTDSDGDAFVPPDEASSGDGDGDADEGDPEDESEDMDMDADLDQEDDDVLLTIDTKPRRIPGTFDPSAPFAPPKKKNGGHLPRPAAMSAAAAASEDRAGLVDIPPAYRAAMESMADRMVNSSGGGVKEERDAEEEADVAPPAMEKRNGKSHSKATRPVLSFLPRGTPLPWSSLLRATKHGESSTSNKKGKGKVALPGPSAGGPSEEVVFRVGEGRLDRKWRNGRLAISCVLGTPRSGWEGEGWYPEMSDASAAVASGTEQDAGQEVAYEDLDIDPRTGQMSLPQKKKGRRPGSSKVEMAAAADAPLRMSAAKGSTAGKGARIKGKRAKVVDDDDEYDGEEGTDGVTAASREALFGPEQRGTIQDRPPAGWTLRGDVRLGLDGVGRFKADKLRLLSADDADSYLPTTIDDFGNTSHTIHLGPFGHQEVVQMSLFDSFANEQYSHVDKGWTFHAGGPVWGLDWCPLPPTQIGVCSLIYKALGGRKYLAVSTLPHIETSTALGEKWPSDTKGSIQIWSIPPIASDDGEAEDVTSAGEGAICEMVLCVQGAPVTSCKWMPLGAWDDINDKTGNGLPKMGIIAALQLDGSISLHPVPHPSAIRRARRSASDLEDEQPLFLELPTPLLRIEITDASPTCMEWFTGSKLAAGYNDAIWNVLPNLLDPSIPLLPDTYVQVADAAITALSVGRMPPKDGQNRFIFDADPVYVCCTSYDLTTRVVDMREPQHPYELGRTRCRFFQLTLPRKGREGPTIGQGGGAAEHNMSPIHADIDYVINMQKIKEDGPAKTLSLAVHRGPVWDVGTSDYHTMVVTASSDGSTILCSARMGANRVKTPAARQYRLMEMDYDQHTGHYRLLDSFAPESQTSEQAVSRRVNSGPDRADVTVIKTANWDPRVAVHRVAWNDGCGIANAGLLALGTAMGLVRVQEMQPEWYRGNEEFVQRFPN